MKGIKITIPDYHDVFLDDLSYLQIGEQTDLVCLTGGHFKYYYKSFKVVPCSSISATKTFVGGIVPKVDAYYKDDFYSRADADSPRVSIRPILELSDDMFDAIISNSEVFNVEFEDHTYEAINLGTYPQYPASLPLQLALSLGEKRLPKTNNKFTLSYKDGLQTCEEYLFNGKKYIKIKVNIIPKKDGTKREKKQKRKFRMSNNGMYKDTDKVWMENSPVIWIIDRKHKRLISFKNLLAGIPIDKSMFYDGVFKKSYMKGFLNDYLLHDLLQDSILTKNSLFVMDSLLESINELHKYYRGKENIPARVAKLVKEYNQHVDKVTSNDLQFQVEYKPIRFYRDELISELEEIRDMLEREAEKVKPYLDLQQILEGKNKNDELTIFLVSIKEKIESTKLLENKKAGLLNDYMSVIIKHISKCKTAINNYRETNEIPKKSLDLLKQEFRIDLHTFLEELHIAGQIANENQEKEDMKNSINEQYEKDKNDRVKSYQDSIDESATHIRAIGNDEDIDELEQILDYKLDYSKTIKELVDELEKIFYKVRAIELKAQERIDIKNRNKIYKLNPRDISILKEYAVDGSLPDGLRRGPC